jgi:hypothetical protein
MRAHQSAPNADMSMRSSGLPQSFQTVPEDFVARRPAKKSASAEFAKNVRDVRRRKAICDRQTESFEERALCSVVTNRHQVGVARRWLGNPQIVPRLTDRYFPAHFLSPRTEAIPFTPSLCKPQK